MFDTFTVITIIVTFLFAGTVKGVIGLGLAIISLGLLTMTIGLQEAMGLLIVPSFVTNFWQAIVGGNAKTIIKRLWVFFTFATAAVFVGAIGLLHFNLYLLASLLGVLLVFYSTISLVGFRFVLNRRQELRISPLAGSINGILTGLTGSFVVPGVMFLQAIELPKDKLIQAMGILFTLSTLALTVALQSNNLLTIETSILSAFALIPAILGMIIGQQIRKKLSEVHFRHVFFICLLMLGVYIICSQLFSWP
tara:strand:+ start:3788 stop:4540 length:753 start_codon:yes stop_codon:yes gene_type:complete